MKTGNLIRFRDAVGVGLLLNTVLSEIPLISTSNNGTNVDEMFGNDNKGSQSWYIAARNPCNFKSWPYVG